MLEARLREGEAGGWMGVRDGEELMEAEYPWEPRDTELGRPRGRGDSVYTLIYFKLGKLVHCNLVGPYSTI